MYMYSLKEPEMLNGIMRHYLKILLQPIPFRIYQFQLCKEFPCPCNQLKKTAHVHFTLLKLTQPSQNYLEQCDLHGDKRMVSSQSKIKKMQLCIHIQSNRIN